ncbi:hypothetical protein HDU86_000252 [Geranomyces michiganensis]|nr:hypothetical protein HDU86_000252 [Geranomyces michiganensis]
MTDEEAFAALMTALPAGCAPIAPTLAILAAFTKDQLENYLASHYQGPQLVATCLHLRYLWSKATTASTGRASSLASAVVAVPKKSLSSANPVNGSRLSAAKPPAQQRSSAAETAKPPAQQRTSAEPITDYTSQSKEWQERGDVVAYPPATKGNPIYEDLLLQPLSPENRTAFQDLFHETILAMPSVYEAWAKHLCMLIRVVDLSSRAFCLYIRYSETGPQTPGLLLHTVLTHLGKLPAEPTGLHPLEILEAANLKLILIVDEAQDIYVRSSDPAHASRISFVQELKTLSQLRGVSVVLSGSGYHLVPLTFREHYFGQRAITDHLLRM